MDYFLIRSSPLSQLCKWLPLWLDRRRANYCLSCFIFITWFPLLLLLLLLLSSSSLEFWMIYCRRDLNRIDSISIFNTRLQQGPSDREKRGAVTLPSSGEEGNYVPGFLRGKPPVLSHCHHKWKKIHKQWKCWCRTYQNAVWFNLADKCLDFLNTNTDLATFEYLKSNELERRMMER